MILIQSCKFEYSTDDVIDWLYYLSSNVEVKRLNDFQEIINIQYFISDTDERILLKTNDEEVDSDARTKDLRISNLDGSDEWRGDKETTTCPCQTAIGNVHEVIIGETGETYIAQEMCE